MRSIMRNFKTMTIILFLQALPFFLLLPLIHPLKADTKQLHKVEIAYITFDDKLGMIKPTYPMIDTAVRIALNDRRSQLMRKGWDVSIRTYLLAEEPIKVRDTMKLILGGPTIGGVGLSVSAYATIGGPVIKDTDYTVVSPFATATKLLKYAPNLLLLSDPNTGVSSALEKFLNENFSGKKVVSIVTWNRSYNKDLYQSMSDKFKKESRLIKLVSTNYDISAIADEALNGNPEVIFIPNFADISAVIIKEFTNRGYKGIFVSGDTWGETQGNAFQKLTQGLNFVAYTIRQYSRYDLPEKSQKLQKRLERLSEEKFNIVPILFYDSMSYLLERLLEIQGVPTRSALQAAILNNQIHEGIVGKSCLISEKCVDRKYKVLRVDGEGYHFFSDILIKK